MIHDSTEARRQIGYTYENRFDAHSKNEAIERRDTSERVTCPPHLDSSPPWATRHPLQATAHRPWRQLTAGLLTLLSPPGPRSSTDCQGRCRVLTEEPDVAEPLRGLLPEGGCSGTQVHGAKPVATCRVRGVPAVVPAGTEDFERFGSLAESRPLGC